MTAIYKRELKSYFQSMTGYVLTAFMVVFTGIYFMAYNLNSGYPYFSYVLLSINYILIIIVPLLTMRSFAEERKSRTDQMLLSAPVSLTEVVLEISGDDYCICSTMRNILHISVDYQKLWDGLSESGLFINFNVFPDGMCIHINRNVPFIPHREPDYRGCHNLWRAASGLSLGRTDSVPSNIQDQWYDRDGDSSDDRGSSYLSDDEKLDDFRYCRSYRRSHSRGSQFCKGGTV